ncbi:hypothetical protein LPJ61_005212 [Coemansia biformis]|uniref:Ornithine decarboxylase antizyme n=1 Tax=Coemansia biformis TaxID=1286918 RepID=A0A9W8CW10_9FUNG|nr:hypothetical protein LPJ61_005212 [Coemansia biformis]
MSTLSNASSGAGPAVPQYAGYTQAQHRGHGGRGHDIALRSASSLLSEVFPEGVPSQGVLKSGAQCIAADVRFRALGCERPWHAFIVDDVLYVYVSEFYGTERNFRNAVMALMELAEDVLDCPSVIVVLPKALNAGRSGRQHAQGDGPADEALDTAAAGLVRAFMYSGFELVPPMLYCPSPAYVLLGYDAM